MMTALVEAKRAQNNVLKSVQYNLISCSVKIVVLAIYLIFGTPLLLNQVTMLCISVGTDLLIGISFAREEYERPLHKESRLGAQFFIKSYAILGVMVSAAAVFSYLSAIFYFGFYFQSILYTRYANGFVPGPNSTFNSSSPYLGNTNLDFKCIPSESYFDDYKNSKPFLIYSKSPSSTTGITKP